MRISTKNYHKPTPKKLKQFGDALLAIGSSISISAIATDHTSIAIIALVISAAGNLLTNLFAE